jgi:transposase-like protein
MVLATTASSQIKSFIESKLHNSHCLQKGKAQFLNLIKMANNDEIMCISIKTFECKSCKKKYPAEGFHGKNGKVSTYRCRECRTNYYYMNKYGIAKVQFDDMLCESRMDTLHFNDINKNNHGSLLLRCT